MRSEKYEVFLKKGKRKFLPKKVLRHQKIRINDKYTFNASVWVADTPESNFKPTVNLTLQHNGDKIRFCFHDTVEMITAIEELRKFVADLCVTIHNRHTEAIKEFISFHRDDMLPTIDYYTVHTVIQEKSEDGKTKELLCNKQTGELTDITKLTEGQLQ
jgi:hypothetical protein